MAPCVQKCDDGHRFAFVSAYFALAPREDSCVSTSNDALRRLEASGFLHPALACDGAEPLEYELCAPSPKSYDIRRLCLELGWPAAAWGSKGDPQGVWTFGDPLLEGALEALWDLSAP